MRSLNAHLRDAETHDLLTFHPACPICHQTRLSGAFSIGPAVSARAQALVAAGALAVSAPASGAVALAAEPDNEREGTAQVDSGSGDPAITRDFDPGGEPTNLPEIVTPPILSDPPDASAPVDPSSSADTSDPVTDPGEAPQAAAGPSSASQQAPPPGSTADATPAPPLPATDNATPPAPSASPDSAPLPRPAGGASATPWGGPTDDSDEQADKDQTDRRIPSRSHVQDHPAAATTAANATLTASAPAPVTADAVPAGRRARPGDHTHTVLPGESLWSIASDLLGPDATPARVAREVHHLWQLNHDRIGTGDPDLIMIGTRLMLR